MTKNISPTTFPSLLHGNKTIIRKLFYFILQRSYLKAIPHSGKTWHQEQILSLISVLYGYCLTQMPENWHTMLLYRNGWFCLIEPEEYGEKCLWKEKQLWAGLCPRRVEPVIKFPSPGGKVFRAVETFTSTPGSPCSWCSCHSPAALKHPYPTFTNPSLQKHPVFGVLYQAPLHPCNLGRGWCQGFHQDKKSCAGFHHPSEAQTVEEEEDGRVKIMKPSHCGLYTASLLMTKGREEAL